MKYLDKTMKPRNQEMTQMLMELGHDRHHARKGKNVPRAKQKNEWKKEAMNYRNQDGEE